MALAGGPFLTGIERAVAGPGAVHPSTSGMNVLFINIEDLTAEAVGRDYVYTHKPNPSIVSMHQWNPDLARQELRDAFEKTRDNVLEVNLQDLHTVQNEPHRLTEWTRMAVQLAEEYA